MSSYTIGEILLWLLAAAVLGFVLGWLVRELVLRRRHRPTGATPVPAPVTPDSRGGALSTTEIGRAHV